MTHLTTYKRLTFIILMLIITVLSACQESLEEKAARDAAEYTRKYCPTPVINYTRTDSVSFNKATHVYTYYCTFSDVMDNSEIIDKNRTEITRMLSTAIKESTNMKPYVQAGFHFRYICRSAKNPDVILLQVQF